MLKSTHFITTIALTLATLSCRADDAPASRTAAADTTARQQATAPQGNQPGTSSSAPTVAPGASVGIARSDQLGAYLTDGNGRSLYLLEEDQAGQSTCYEMCVVIWPPFLAGASKPTSADPAVQSNLIGSVPRQGGGAQATYNGHPLYYYLGDAAPGQTRGQHVEDSWGEWYLVSPTGQHVGEDGSRRRGRGGRRERER
jgi:predicted lipoprotein with Yx(FWY)xxD motif